MTTSVFWFDNFNELFAMPEILPSSSLTQEQNLNNLSRLAIIASMGIMLFNIIIGLVVLIVCLVLIAAYYYGKPKQNYYNPKVKYTPDNSKLNPIEDSRFSLTSLLGPPNPKTKKCVRPIAKGAYVNDGMAYTISSVLDPPDMTPTQSWINPRDHESRFSKNKITGSTEYFHDATRMPNYITRNIMDIYPGFHKYGTDLPLNTDNYIERANNLFHSNVSEFRDGMQQTLMQKKNKEMIMRRQYPIRTF